MSFDRQTCEMVRKAVAERRDDLLYVMVSADDGGQTYEMQCRICNALGNVLASTFIHAMDCPVAIEEAKSLSLRQRQ